MIQIKKTKSIEMYGDENGVFIHQMLDGKIASKIYLASERNMTKVFQAKRGLERYVELYHRKPKKKVTVKLPKDMTVKYTK